MKLFQFFLPIDDQGFHCFPNCFHLNQVRTREFGLGETHVWSCCGNIPFIPHANSKDDKYPQLTALSVGTSRKYCGQLRKNFVQELRGQGVNFPAIALVQIEHTRLA